MQTKKINTIKNTSTKRFVPIKLKIIRPVAAIILLAGISAGILTYSITKKTFIEREEFVIGELTNIQAQRLTTLLREKLTLVEIISKNEYLINQVFNSPTQREEQTQILNDYNFKNDYLAIYIMDNEGNTLISTDPAFVGQNYSFRNYFQSAIQGQIDVDIAIGVTSKELGYYFSAPIRLNGEIVGVVVTKLKPEIIDAEMKKITHDGFDSSEYLNYMLADENGMIIYSDNNRETYKFLGSVSVDTKNKIIRERTYVEPLSENINFDDAQEAVEKKETHIHFVGRGGIDSEEKILIMTKTNDFPLYVASVAETDTMSTAANRNAALLMVTVIMAASFTLLVLVITISSVLKPLNKLADVIKENPGTKINPEDIQIESNDEIGRLAKAVRNLTYELIEEKRGVEVKIEKQTKQLQEQKTALMNVLDDVESEKENATKAANDLEKFKLAADNTSEQILITNPEGIIMYANKATERITGFGPDEIIGKKAGGPDLWGGIMPKSFYSDLWYTIKEKKQTFSGEIKNKKKSGEVYVALATISPVMDENGNVIFFVGIERDITKEKEIDRMKTEFISLASHQLRTPLSAMKWFLEMLINEEAGKLTKTQKEFLQNIDKSNERMIDLVNALLNVSRIESGRIIVDPEPTNIKLLVEDLVKDISPRTKSKNISFTLEVEDGIPLINVDPKLIRHVYLNLLTNAIKYTPKEGKITLKISQDKNENVLLSEISDTGYGILEKDKDKVFDKFFRGENIVTKDTDGTGLGLYVVKAIIDSSKGKIWFDSKENEGSTFYFTLPMTGMEAKEGVVSLQG